MDECRAAMEASLSSLKHRGPDAHGMLSGEGYTLGHTRLSIIDLANSHQPMSSPDGRFELSYNGEIYNYRELRLELSSQWDFRSDGDTEVILAGLALQGPSFFKKLSGMWSIILWDKNNQQLLLSRDRFGKKPLYYCSTERYFAAASEIPALKNLLPNQVFSESKSGLVDFIRHGFFRAGETIYENILEVLPGHNLFIDFKQSTSELKPYWALQNKVFDGTKADAEVQFKALFLNSLKQRLTGDVDIGCLLSGGIDSSIVVSCLKKDFGVSPRTFTIGFSDKSYDESKSAAFMADYLGLSNETEIIKSFNYKDIIDLLDQNVGQPFGDASILPSALVSRLASKSVKVCLTGDGADEVLSGYQRYQARIMYQWYIRIPLRVRAMISKVVRNIPASHKHHSRSLLKKAQLFLELVERYEFSNSYLVPRVLSEEHERQFFPFIQQNRGIGDDTCFDGYLDDVLRMMASDIETYLPQDILLKTDRASMAHSLELRSPFLDHELVEFAFSLPRTWHRRGLKGKRLLRDSMHDYLPERIWNKRKQGFSMPLGHWFLGELGDQLLDMTSGVGLEPAIVTGIQQSLKVHRSREKDLSLFLWPMFTYLHWHNKEYCT